MATRPILFSAPMVRALLDGRKTMTRRVITPRNTFFNGSAWSRDAKAQTWNWAGAWVDPGPSPAGNRGPYLKLPWLAGDADWEGTVHRIYPATQPGDLLWVRETWRAAEDVDTTPAGQLLQGEDLWFDADKSSVRRLGPKPGKKRPGIHMPRWASRLTLAVTAVKVERLQDISGDDAFAEGAGETAFYDNAECKVSAGAPWAPERLAFADLWNSINGAGAWDANPWVAAVSFTVHRANVDALPGQVAA